LNNTEKNLKKSGKIIFIIKGALFGVALLVYGSYADSGGEDDKTVSAEESFSELDAEIYAKELEERIAGLCENVRGADNVHVCVTLAGGYTAVYAQNSQSSSSGYKNEFVLSGSGSNEKALLVGYSVPQVSGVGIVCVGGGKPEVRQEIIALVSAALGISSNKIYVSEG